MYVYDIGYGSPEDSKYSQVCHELQYSKEELHQVVMKAIESVLTDILEETEFHCNVYLNEEGVSYDQIHPLVIGKLIMNFGFKQLNYTATWNCFGWASVTMDSWENYKDDTNKRILKELPDELKNKINELGRLKAELDSKEIREWTNTQGS